MLDDNELLEVLLVLETSLLSVEVLLCELISLVELIGEEDIVVVSEVSPIVVLLPGTTFSVVESITSFSYTMIVFSFCFV